MSKVFRGFCVATAVATLAGVVYAAGVTSTPVAQTEAVTASANAMPAIGTMLIVGVGSVSMLVSRMLPRRNK